MNPIKNVRITLISTDSNAAYSGMIPGVIAGHYTSEEATIDLRMLAQKCGARFLNDTVTNVNITGKFVECLLRGKIQFDYLSINTGSQTPTLKSDGSLEPISVKPINNFIKQINKISRKIISSSKELQIGILGGGAAGVETATALNFRVFQNCSKSHDFTIFTSGKDILTGHSKKARRLYNQKLSQLKIRKKVLFNGVQIKAKKILSANGQAYPCDYLFSAIGAEPPSWLKNNALKKNESGFILVNKKLQSVSHGNIFAAGDVCEIEKNKRPKSGVFAVRQGKVLAVNLRRHLLNQSLTDYQPQKTSLALLSTGEKNAVASHPYFGSSSGLIWNYKNFIDRNFLRKYKKIKPMENKKEPIEIEEIRCGGCGSKVGNTILSDVIKSLLPKTKPPSVLIGLNEPDDAAVTRLPVDTLSVQTIDYFKEFIDDPWMAGRIAANHALSDIFAMGATPHTAMAIAGIPVGGQKIMKNDLKLLMEGSLTTLMKENTVLVGGHTNEASEINIGFSVNGFVKKEQILKKSGGQEGDSIFLTKPLGTGVLFAGLMAGVAKGAWIDDVLIQMTRSNSRSAEILTKYASCMTDVTGFGLVGHLSEMLKENLSAEIYLDCIPIYRGAEELSRLGIESTLLPENLKTPHKKPKSMDNHDKIKLCFDPQTAGGILAIVNQKSVEECQKALSEADSSYYLIGKITKGTKKVHFIG